MEPTFLDTNVLVYADDLDAGPKRDRALNLVEEHVRARAMVVSTQVLQEFFVVVTRKLGVPADVARRKVELLASQEVITIQPTTILAAIDLHRLHSLSFWDALIVSAASLGGCTRLLSEDLQHGQVFNNVRIENPFLDIT